MPSLVTSNSITAASRTRYRTNSCSANSGDCIHNPYHRGYGSLRPEAIERVLAQMDETTKKLGLVVSIPCDSAGRALPGRS